MKTLRKNIIFVAMVGIWFLCGNTWAVDDGLVAHWKLDEVSGTTAYDSVGSNDGTLVNDPTWTTGQIGGGLSFDGVDDYVDCGTTFASVAGSTSKTITAWVNSDTMDYSAQHDQNGRILALHRSPGSTCFSILAKGNPATWSALYTEQPNLNAWFDSGVAVTAGEWAHIALVQDGTDVHYYINGVLENSVNNASAPFISNPVKASIGVFLLGYGSYFNGIIDDVRIYNKSLSAEEVEELYYGQLLSLEVVGPDEVAENFSASYKAIAHYGSGVTSDVTDLADWSVEPNMHASIESGLLSTGGINRPEDITIYAQYTEDTNSVEAEKAVTIFAICLSGSALEFDGVDDYVSVPDSASLDITGDEITVVAWFKPGATGNNNRPIVSKWLGSNSAYVLLYTTGSVDLIGFAVNTGGTAVGDNPTPVNDINKWYHLAGVYDGSYITVYVDGVAGAAVADTGNINNSSKTLRISGYGEGAQNPHHIIGLVDEVRLYDRALSAEEIRANMHTRLAGDEPNLAAYWDFDEGTGQIAYDMSSNDNHGYLGSDPCETDGSDPAWVESDAPIGICTIPQLIERNITDALETKLDILEELETALMKEDAAMGLLEDLFRIRDYSDFGKNDIVKAKQNIHSAIQSEEQAGTAVDRSIDNLEDSLNELGYEVEP